jgi:hypothetical protein
MTEAPERAAAGPFAHRLTGTILRGDDEGSALVVNEPTDPLDGLIALVRDEYGGEWSRENPVLVEASQQAKVQVWRSCTKAWREGEGVYDEWASDWWAPHGDGARQVLVVWYPDSVYALGERAEAAEPLAEPREPNEARDA